MQSLLLRVAEPVTDFVDFEGQLRNVLFLHEGALDVHKVQRRCSTVAQSGPRCEGLDAVLVKQLAIQLDGPGPQWFEEHHLGFRVSETSQGRCPPLLHDTAELGLVANQECLVVTLGHDRPLLRIENQRLVAALLPLSDGEHLTHQLDQFTPHRIGFALTHGEGLFEFKDADEDQRFLAGLKVAVDVGARPQDLGGSQGRALEAFHFACFHRAAQRPDVTVEYGKPFRDRILGQPTPQKMGHHFPAALDSLLLEGDQGKQPHQRIEDVSAHG